MNHKVVRKLNIVLITSRIVFSTTKFTTLMNAAH